MDCLHHLHAALIIQGSGQQGLKGLFLLCRRLGRLDIEKGVNECLMADLGIMGVKQRIVDIGGPVIKGREQKAHLRGGNHMGGAAVVELLILCDVMQIGFRLLHRADRAQKVCIDLFGSILQGRIILALEGYIIAVTSNEDQIIIIESNIFNDLFEKLHTQVIILQLGLTQLHEHFMLRAVGNLGGTEGDIDEILTDGAGKGALEHTKVLFRLALRHHAGALLEGRNDLLLGIDIAAVNSRHIAAIPADSAPDLAYFFRIHSNLLLLVPKTVPVLNKVLHAGVDRGDHDQTDHDPSQPYDPGKAHHDAQTDHRTGGLKLTALAGSNDRSLAHSNQAQTGHGKLTGQHDHQRPSREHAPLTEHDHGRNGQKLIRQGIQELTEIADLVILSGNIAIDKIRQAGNDEHSQ